MTIAKTVHDYLEARNLKESITQHAHTATSAQTAQEAHVPGRQLAKAVVLRAQDDYHLLVVIPAHRLLAKGKVSDVYGGHLDLAQERELSALFPDCELGAIPALGMAYQLPTYVDQSLFEQPEVFFEGGDHESLVRLSRKQFGKLFDEAAVGDFSQTRH